MKGRGETEAMNEEWELLENVRRQKAQFASSYRYKIQPRPKPTSWTIASPSLTLLPNCACIYLRNGAPVYLHGFNL